MHHASAALRAALFAAFVAAPLTATAARAAGSGDHAHGHSTSREDAHGGHGNHGGHDESADVGGPGEAARVRRNINVVMRDSEFEPAKLRIRPGETVRFRVRNAGELVHEFNIGTARMHVEHQAEMTRMMEAGHMTADRVLQPMAHAHGNSALLEPGASGEVIWNFPKGGVLEFACNVPGHYEAGMKGPIEIR